MGQVRHDVAMTEPDRPTQPGEDVLSSLPPARPQRRSSKRGEPDQAARAGPPTGRPPTARSSPARKPAAAKSTPPPTPAAKAAKPAGVRPSAATHKARGAPEPPPLETRPPANGMELAGTAVQAAGELAQLGLSVGARVLRKVASRVPRP